MQFEWDEDKERENVKKHGISFEAAERVFFDYSRIERFDADSSIGEDRWQTIGKFDDVLFVVYTERGETTRIITARLATRKERRIYNGDSEAYGWQRVNP